MRREARERLARVHQTFQEVQIVKAENKVVDVNRLHDLADNWKDDRIPLLQRRVIDVQLENLRNEVIDPVYLTFIKALRSVKLKTFSFLDVGCASGYYSEVLKLLDRRKISYTGCDYSAAMIECAKQHYPDVEFSVQDVTSLTYPSNAFDVVMASGVLHYVADYRQALVHILRVARQYAIFHRLPLTTEPENAYNENSQYSIVTARAYFSKTNILREITGHGFALVHEMDVYRADSLLGRCRRFLRGTRRGSEKKESTETLVFRRQAG